MKASFFKRLGAYLLDTIFLTIIVAITTIGMTSKEYDDAYNKYLELNEKYMAQEITIGEYLDDISPLMYTMNKSSVLVTGINVGLSIAYFIVFQYLNKGQTLGKKLLKIKVVENGKDPSLKSMIIRSILIDSIFSGLIGIIFIFVLNQNTYYLGYSIVQMIETMFIFVSALFVLYRKDKLGLHDIIAHTEVLEERGN